jgi:recombination protein RecT
MTSKNEVATKDTFSGALTIALNEQKEALPADFNITRFVQNSIALLNGNDTLADFAKQYGTAQIKNGLIRGAYLGLDALNQEMYLVPYKNVLNFMPSYKGMVKLAQKYSARPIKSIYAKCVREGDFFEESIVNGEPAINYKAIPFNGNEIIGVFAVCQYVDGGIVYEVMSKVDVEQCRKSSKAKNSPAWNSYWSEMAKKTVLRRLCKSLTLDMDAKAAEAFDSGLEHETDVKEISKMEIEENANSEPFPMDDVMDAEAEVIE